MSKVELKNIKYAAFASDETNCFQAAVYIDGVRAGTVDNEGHGGNDRFDPHTLEHRLNEIAKGIPKYSQYTFEVGSVLVGDLLNAHLLAKDLKRMMKKAMVFETLDGKFGMTKNVPDHARAQFLANPVRSLAILKGKRFVTDFDQAFDLYLKLADEQAAESRAAFNN